MGTFVDALQAAGEPPCVKFGCGSRDRCAERRLACYAFWWFVETGRAVPPTLSKDGQKMRRTRKPIAVRSIYWHLFPDEGEPQPEYVLGMSGARAGRGVRPRVEA